MRDFSVDKRVEEWHRDDRAPKTIVAWERPRGGPTMTTMTRMARGAAVLFAPVALAAGVFVSRAKAAPSICSSKACSEEIAAGCAGLSGMALKACKSLILDQCKAGTCTCTMQPGLPDCTPTTTSTTTTSTTSTTTTSTTTTSTTTAVCFCTIVPIDPGAICTSRCQSPGVGGCRTGSDCLLACAGPGPGCGVQSLACVATCPTTTTTTTIPPCTFLLTWGSSGSGDGQFANPADVATDGSGNVYVADTNNNRIQKFDASGTFLTTWGNFGSGNGQFSSPPGVATNGSGNVYVADTNNDRIQKFACP